MTGPVPQLQANGLELRPWRSDDAAAILALSRDPAARAWMASLGRVDDLADAQAWIAVRQAPDRIDWVATRDGSVVGRVGLHHFRPEDDYGEIGYAVWPEHRRQGVATTLVQAATRHAFTGLGLHRLALIHATANRASCAVAARCGFGFEGVARQAMPAADGRRLDEHRHARLATDPPGPVAPAPPPPTPVEGAVLTAGDLVLRPPSPADAADTRRIFADADVVRWNPGPDAASPEAVRSWLAGAADWSHGNHATFAVTAAAGGRLLGHVALHRIDQTHGDAEIGYRVAPWARGAGVATRAVAAVTRWAFTSLGLDRVEILHAVENSPSCRVAEGAGFRLEGVRRLGYRYPDGLRHDEHLHARLATDRPS